MKKVLAITMTILVTTATVYPQNTLYLSPGGNDANDGSIRNPLATLEGAMNKREWSITTGDTLFVMMTPCDYYIFKTQAITKPPRRPVVIRGEGKTKPRIIGGMKMGGWEHYKDKIYRAPWPKRGSQHVAFEQLFVNGRRATLARTPNSGWAFVKGFEEHQEGNTLLRRIRLEKKHHQLLRKMSAEERNRIRLHMLQKWDMFLWDFSYASLSRSDITFSKCRMNSWNPIEEGTRYVLFNYRGALDAEGEWFADPSDHYVYYIPRQGEDMTTAEVICPLQEKILTINGSKGRTINNITIENIQFCYSAHVMPDGGEGTIQSAADMTACVEINYSNNIIFRKCDFAHTAGYGLWLNALCSNCSVSQCLLTDLGAGGIKLGNIQAYHKGQAVTHHITIDNNIISDGGKVSECGAGILNLHSSDNTITHNDIHHLYYTGISIGWTWGYNNDKQHNPVQHVTVAYNHIHHIGQGILSDMGGIYTLGEQPGTLITNNVVHDVQSYDYGGIGIYTDEGSSNITIRNNLVYRCSEGCYQHHYGRDNVVENNIFAFSPKQQVLWIVKENHSPFTFRHNIILHNGGLTLNDSPAWHGGRAHIEENLYWSIQGRTSFATLTFSQWQRQVEPKALEADPLFVNAPNGNYHFRSLDNIRKIHFTPFDYESAGTYNWESGEEKQ